MKVKRSMFAIGVLFAFVAIAGAQSKPDPRLEAMAKRQVEAQLAYDQAALARITTDDYIEISPLGEFDPREKMLGFYTPDQRPAGLDVGYELKEVNVRDHGKFGIVIARIDYLMTKDGNKLPPRSIRVTLVCRKIGNEWKIASAQYTGIREAAPKPVIKSDQ